LRERIRDRLVEIVKEEVVTRAHLDAAAAAKVGKVFQEKSPPILDLRRDTARSVRELKLLLDKPGEDARIQELTDPILQNQQKIQALDRERALAVRAVLTPTEFGRILAVMPQIMRDTARRVREAIGRKDE